MRYALVAAVGGGCAVAIKVAIYAVKEQSQALVDAQGAATPLADLAAYVRWALMLEVAFWLVMGVTAALLLFLWLKQLKRGRSGARPGT